MELKNTNNQPTTEVLLTRKPTSLQPPIPAVTAKPKTPFKPLSDEFEMEFSETYNLTRLTPEEAEARIKQLEKMEKQRALTRPTITDKPKATVDYNPSEKTFKMPFSETYNLHRVSAEEAAVRLKKLEEKEKQHVSSQPRRFEMPFSETYNLHRVSDEEAAARLKKLEEKEKRR